VKEVPRHTKAGFIFIEALLFKETDHLTLQGQEGFQGAVRITSVVIIMNSMCWQV
jgi:hypothetical protein